VREHRTHGATDLLLLPLDAVRRWYPLELLMSRLVTSPTFSILLTSSPETMSQNRTELSLLPLMMRLPCAL